MTPAVDKDRVSPDHVDRLIDQWRLQRPDLDVLPMEVFARLGRLMNHAMRAIETGLAAHELTVGDFDVLSALRRAGLPFELKPIDLARGLMLSPAGITSRLDRLEAAGHVERRMDPVDRRSFLVRLTGPGLDVIDRAVTDHVANEATLLEGLSRRDVGEINRILRSLLVQFET